MTTSRDALTTLGDVARLLLMSGGEFPRSSELYIRRDGDWGPTTPCAILETPESIDPDADDQVPDLARRQGLTAVLEGSVVEEVFENVRLQTGRPKPEQLVQALRHYFDHDAFMSFCDV
jgi:hypothetical protein